MAKTPNIRCFVAKLHLSQFTQFLGIIFSTIKLIQIELPLLLIHYHKLAIDQICYRWKRLAIEEIVEETNIYSSLFS